METRRGCFWPGYEVTPFALGMVVGRDEGPLARDANVVMADDDDPREQQSRVTCPVLPGPGRGVRTVLANLGPPP